MELTVEQMAKRLGRSAFSVQDQRKYLGLERAATDAERKKEAAKFKRVKTNLNANNTVATLLTDGELEALRTLAEMNNCTMSFLIRRLIRSSLSRNRRKICQLKSEKGVNLSGTF
jgi:hypothetical protein